MFPPGLMATLKGRVWRKIIPRAEETEHYREQYAVILSRLVGGQTMIHVIADADPGNGYARRCRPRGRLFRDAQRQAQSGVRILMFRKIAAFDCATSSAPLFWVSSFAFFALTFMATTIPQIQIGDKGNTNINSPYAVIEVLQVMGIFAIFLMTAFVANVVVRDDETGYTGPSSVRRASRRFDYLFGRFTGAFIAGVLAFATVPLAILLGSMMPWLDMAKVGPFRPEDYLYAYFLVALPTLFMTAAGFFALATATRSMLATYIGVVACSR